LGDACGGGGVAARGPRGPRRVQRSDRQSELPRLRRTDPGAHAPTGRCHGARQSGGARATGGAGGPDHRRAALRFLPPYSPDFNPIELAFAKLKAFLRAARRAASIRSVRSSPPHSISIHPPNAPTTSVTAAIESLQRYEKRLSVLTISRRVGIVGVAIL
jgi:transposase